MSVHIGQLLKARQGQGMAQIHVDVRTSRFSNVHGRRCTYMYEDDHVAPGGGHWRGMCTSWPFSSLKAWAPQDSFLRYRRGALGSAGGLFSFSLPLYTSSCQEARASSAAVLIARHVGRACGRNRSVRNCTRAYEQQVSSADLQERQDQVTACVTVEKE